MGMVLGVGEFGLWLVHVGGVLWHGFTGWSPPLLSDGKHKLETGDYKNSTGVGKNRLCIVEGVKKL